ncbi:hypothetical protein Skr01_36210 [Sphaerisporangium krabiense]|uniref:Uncharacterized protein n=1 Tax=Sphaerisporangium krabiense TaxID=763782 RepID=A0A7W8Z3A0_9ACTN|nr:hypothetical protein [Sphaerisporangium krabiense]MBB5626614.1 hypothetical protein [Sphaerisporangium krabiense]GII63536.1 hypothetical protein Skr01_36210 [Sphaerisporangium krabiense]
MATVRLNFDPELAQFAASSFPAFDRVQGTNFPVTRLLFDPGATETAYFKFEAVNYGSGNLTCDIIWYAVNATTGVVRWEVALAAITQESDSQDVETKAFATALTVDDTHLGTTSKRLHKATITISNLDSIAAGDECWLRVSRLGGHANDTLVNDVAVTEVRLSYSDT